MPIATVFQRMIPAPERLLDMGISLLLTLAVAFLLWQLALIIVSRVERWIARAAGQAEGGEQRARTLGSIVRWFSGAVIIGGAFIHALEVLGWNVRPLLAGAGIAGVALGLGAQTLIRDMIAGFFILVENQFAVGDLIEVNGQAATVEDLTLRRTRLRDFNGFVYFVPNGEMKVVVNRSRGWTRTAVDLPIAADADIDHALAVCRSVVSGMNADPVWKERVLEPIDLWGIESMLGVEVTIRMILRARPGPDGPQTARELKRRLMAGLSAAGIRARTSREIVIMPIPGGEPSPEPASLSVHHS